MPEIGKSELIINEDGSIFHLHLLPEQLADRVVLVGDPARVKLVASYFGTIECEVSSREFHSATGSYKGKRITVLSHGIGGDNIDIVLTELDALANIDFTTREVKKELRQLTLVRIGTSGAMQKEIPLGGFVASEKSIGYEGAIYFYNNNASARDLEFEKAFANECLGSVAESLLPYVVNSSASLLEQIASDMHTGVTISANGFYGAQGRALRLPLQEEETNQRIEAFRFNGKRVTNYEMEGAALAGLATLMGHRALTVCCIIAHRHHKEVNVNYTEKVTELIKKVLDRI